MTVDTARSRSGVIGVFAIAATIASLFLWAFMLAGPWRLATGLLDAGDHLDRAQAKLSKGALKDARYETLAGAAAARRARAGFDSDSPLLDLARVVPRIDGILDESELLVGAAEHSSDAALGTLEIAQGALRGPDRIVAEDEDGKGSVIQIDRVRELGEVISQVRTDIAAAADDLARVDPSVLPRRSRPRIEDALTEARSADDLLADAEAGFEILPSFLGAEGPRSYLLGFQNPDELRGTGGSILRFAELHIEDGVPTLERGGSVYKIDQDRTTFDIPLPKDAWYVRSIEDAQRFGNANWSPDWPLSSKLTVAYGRRAAREFADAEFPSRIDGVIGVDPMAVEKVMPGVGAYVLPDYRNRITADSVLYFVLYKAYAAYPIAAQRRAVLQEVVDGFYDGLIDPTHPTELAQGLGEALRFKNMQIWMADHREQDFVERMEWDGGIRKASGSDYLYVVEQNVGGNKFDYFDDQSTEMDIAIDGRDVRVRTSVSITHSVFFPQPRWVLGDSSKGDAAKKASPPHRPMINVYVPGAAELSSAEVRGTRLDTPLPAIWPSDTVPAEHTERGKKVWSTTLDILPEETGTVRFGYRVPGVIRTDGDRSVYRLVLQHQPKVQPETMTVSLTPPPGATDIDAPGWVREGKRLVWSKSLKEDLVLEVSWQR